MIITDIKPQVKNNKRFSIFIDGEFKFGLTDVDVLFYRLKIGDEISDKKYKMILEEVVYNNAVSKASNYLSYKMRTEKEVREKLKDEFSQEVIDKVITMLCKYNYINDLDYAISYAKDASNLKRWGEDRIKMELRLKGIADINIIEALEAISDKENTEQTIEALLERRIKATPIDLKEKKKHFEFLKRRGFKSDDILNVLKKYC